jgi:hypothetical protein
MKQWLKPKLKARAIQIAKIVHVVDVAVVVAAVDVSQDQPILMRTQVMTKILKIAILKMTVPVLTVAVADVALPEMV